MLYLNFKVSFQVVYTSATVNATQLKTHLSQLCQKCPGEVKTRVFNSGQATKKKAKTDRLSSLSLGSRGVCWMADDRASSASSVSFSRHPHSPSILGPALDEQLLLLLVDTAIEGASPFHARPE